jgi:hypothetical protein
MPASQRRSASRRAAARRGRVAPVARILPRILWLGAALAIATTVWWFASDSGVRGGAPLDEIDAASRQKLESLLRQNEPDPGAP